MNVASKLQYNIPKPHIPSFLNITPKLHQNNTNSTAILHSPSQYFNLLQQYHILAMQGKTTK
jgi:hypothetical protein